MLSNGLKNSRPGYSNEKLKTKTGGCNSKNFITKTPKHIFTNLLLHHAATIKKNL